MSSSFHIQSTTNGIVLSQVPFSEKAVNDQAAQLALNRNVGVRLHLV
jgi:hypothetical protein